MYQLRFKVLGKSWRLRVLPGPKYRKKHGLDSVAITRMHKRTVDLSPLGVDLETISHELVHVYMHEMCITSMEISLSDQEEFFAELLSRRGYELLDLAKHLHGKVTCLLLKDRAS